MQTKTFTTELPIGLHEFATVYGRDISKPAELFTLKCLLADEKINHTFQTRRINFDRRKRSMNTISIESEIPEFLQQELFDFVKENPGWDCNKAIAKAIEIFLQNQTFRSN